MATYNQNAGADNQLANQDNTNQNQSIGEQQTENLGVGQQQTGNLQQGQAGNLETGQQTLPVTDTPQIASEEYNCLDFNEDGVVNVQDVIYAAQTYGATTAGMVQRFMSGGNPYDINEDGLVNSQDIILAVANNCPQSIIDKMTEIVLTPPPPPVEETLQPAIGGTTPEPTIEFNPQPALGTGQSIGNYHPLDLNQDGDVNVQDILYATNNGMSDIVKTMIFKYISNENPYDIDGDGLVSVTDITLASQAGVPQNIIQDMQNNILTQTTQQPIPVPESEIETEVENLYTNGNEFVVIPGRYKYNGPYHYHQKGEKKTFMTELTHRHRLSKMLFPIDMFDATTLKEYNEGRLETIQPVPRLTNGGRLF